MFEHVTRKTLSFANFSEANVATVAKDRVTALSKNEVFDFMCVLARLADMFVR